MTSFVKRMIENDEATVFSTRLHWIYIVWGVFWFAFVFGLGYIADMMLWKYFGSTISWHRQEIWYLVFGARYPWLTWLCFLAGAVIFVIHFLKVIATEIVLTDQRLIYKTGWIFVDVKEVDIAEIRAEEVNHGILGRFLRYGEIHLDSRFVGNAYLPAIRRPYELLKHIHHARKKLHDPLEE